MHSNINILRSCVVHVTIFITDGKFRPVSIFTYLHAFTLVARSYALLLLAIIQTQKAMKNHQIYLSMSGTLGCLDCGTGNKRRICNLVSTQMVEYPLFCFHPDLVLQEKSCSFCECCILKSVN